MCGRYTLTRHERVAEDLQATLGETITSGSAAAREWWKPRFNVAPTQPAPVVVLADNTRTLELMRWGLVPFWAGADPKKAPLMINARVETLTRKAFFREGLAHRRCLVPADGFFEWRRADRAKPLPIYFRRADRGTIAFAGLWAKARTATGEQLSFTIITGPPAELVAPVHDRMPVVLPEDAHAAWLDPATDGDTARALLAVPALDGWVGEPVSTHVNKAQHDDPSCIAPLAADEPAQRSLF
jgi:putative SOS response-associated peptidase YedK